MTNCSSDQLVEYSVCGTFREITSYFPFSDYSTAYAVDKVKSQRNKIMSGDSNYENFTIEFRILDFLLRNNHSL